MKTLSADVLVIGGGPAGLSAALAAKRQGAEQVVILERNEELGGILQQCIHHGFGIHRFREELTGPEYAQRFIDELSDSGVSVYLETMVLELTDERVVYAINKGDGMLRFEAKAVVLAMGCRERTRGALRIPGHRPAGVMTAGAAQRFVNIEGYVPGQRVVILGSGDIGLIMARRFTLEGASVEAVAEVLPYAAGLTRNVVQCLHDFDIPLYLSSTVVEIHGRDRVEAVTIADVDESWKPIAGSERTIACDTLLLSVGLIPENELSVQAGAALDSITNGPIVDHTLMTNLPGVFACGNVLHVHDLVDFVSEEAETAGINAAAWSRSQPAPPEKTIAVKAGDSVRYVLPQYLSPDKTTKLYMRVAKPETNVAINIGGLFSLKQKSIRPSEMIQVKLTPKVLSRLESDSLTVEVEREVERVG